MTMDEPDAREVVRSLPRGPYMLPSVIGDGDRSDAAKRLAAVVATAGQVGTSPAPATSPSDVSTQSNTLATLVAAPPHPAPSDSAVWSEAELTALVTALTVDSTITGSQHPGVTRGRIQHALPAHLKPHARLVLLWLEAAGLLAPPIKPEEPFRHPRRLRSCDPLVLRATLSATPVPQEAW